MKIIAVTIICASLLTLSLIISDSEASIKRDVEGEWIKTTDGRIALVQN